MKKYLGFVALHLYYLTKFEDPIPTFHKALPEWQIVSCPCGKGEDKHVVEKHLANGVNEVPSLSWYLIVQTANTSLKKYAGDSYKM